jgi:NAD(P)-dependent dehydrogenase (short-subunit alcohol dehydrogenase family)
VTAHAPEPLLAGRVAVVTGGGGGIGLGIVETFAAHGARVVVADVDGDRAAAAAEQVRAGGGQAVAVTADVRQRAAVEQVRAAARETFGDPDVLVNNVGHYLPGSGDFFASDEEEWRGLYAVNLEHVFLCTQVLVPSMVEAGRGSVVNVSSVEAFRAIPSRPVYAAFKGAITQFTKSLAVDLGRSGVRVNAIAPDLTESLQVPYSRWVPEEQQDRIPGWVPVGRFGTATDIAGVALFLASDLSAFVTGTTVHADGGSLAAGGWFRRPDGTWTNRPIVE